MAQSNTKVKVYLDENGEAIKDNVNTASSTTLDTSSNTQTQKKVYLDESGEPISDAPEIVTPRNASLPTPDTFGKGFIRSMLGGEALNTGIEGAKGYLKGAIDIPGAIMGGIETAKNLYNNPMGTISSIPAGLKEMYDLTMQAGSRPEEFGRMMGETTGLPLTTAGLAKSTPSAIRGAGAVTEGTGKLMRKYQPITATPIVGPLAGRGLQRLERMAGSGIEKVGQRMRNVGGAERPATLADEVLGTTDDVEMGELLNSAGRPIKPNSAMVDDIVPDEIIDNPINKPNKPKARLNPDGTYTNLDTGEVVNWAGKPMAEPVVKPPTTIKNAPPNQRAKILRGMNDPVDVLFPDANSREIFGAGQRLFSKPGTINPATVQRATDAANRISKEYNLSIEKARKMVNEYNARIRTLSKDFPKYGENLNFKAPSFEEFLTNYKDSN